MGEGRGLDEIRIKCHDIKCYYCIKPIYKEDGMDGKKRDGKLLLDIYELQEALSMKRAAAVAFARDAGAEVRITRKLIRYHAGRIRERLDRMAREGGGDG